MDRQIVTIVDAPVLSLSDDDRPGDVLLKFYRGVGWNGVDRLNPCKVRTTKAVFCDLFDLLKNNWPDPLSVGMTMVNVGPGTDDYVPPGKVCLLEGWTTPDES